MNPIFAETSLSSAINVGLLFAIFLLACYVVSEWLFGKFSKKSKENDALMDEECEELEDPLNSDEELIAAIRAGTDAASQRQIETTTLELVAKKGSGEGDDSDVEVVDPENGGDDRWGELPPVAGEPAKPEGGVCRFDDDADVMLVMPDGIELPLRDLDSDESDFVGQLRADVVIEDAEEGKSPREEQ